MDNEPEPQVSEPQPQSTVEQFSISAADNQVLIALIRPLRKIVLGQSPREEAPQAYRAFATFVQTHIPGDYGEFLMDMWFHNLALTAEQPRTGILHQQQRGPK